MFSVCLFTGGAPRSNPPPPNLDKNDGQNLGQKMDKVLDKKWTKFWTNILETFGGGGAGGTPLAVTQEDCLVKLCVSV